MLGLCLAVLSGCATDSEKIRHLVGESQLNWLDIHYMPGKGQPMTRISIGQTGHVVIQRGTSPALMDDFSQDVASKEWPDLETNQANLPSDEIRQVFQDLVSRGVLLPANKEFLEAQKRSKGPLAHISGQLDNERVDRMVAEPELLDMVKKIATFFDTNPDGQPRKNIPATSTQRR